MDGLVNDRRRRRRSVPRRILIVLVAFGLFAAHAGSARAGTWTLVSCTQPSGVPAPTDGWSTGRWAGSGSAGSGNTNTCASGGSLTAVSSAAGEPASDTGPEWIFTAPAGATITGGSLTAALTSPQGQTWLSTPGPAYDGPDLIVSCAVDAPCGTAGTLTGTFPIDHPGGTTIYAPALCVQSTSPTCPLLAGDAVNAEVSIHQAVIELGEDAAPAGTDFTGGLLSGRASGTAELRFTASDPGAAGGFGPGVAMVTVTLDGHTVSSAAPNSEDGACVPLGTDAATGGLIYDHLQPCPQITPVRVAVPTTGLSDGPHRLVVTVTDAAGATATVLQRTITTSNAHTSPANDRPGEPNAQLVYHYALIGRLTRLTVTRALGLPATARVTLVCSGPRCPPVSGRRTRAAGVARLFAALAHHVFAPRDVVSCVVREPRRRAETIVFVLRAAQPPRVQAGGAMAAMAASRASGGGVVSASLGTVRRASSQ